MIDRRVIARRRDEPSFGVRVEHELPHRDRRFDISWDTRARIGLGVEHDNTSYGDAQSDDRRSFGVVLVDAAASDQKMRVSKS